MRIVTQGQSTDTITTTSNAETKTNINMNIAESAIAHPIGSSNISDEQDISKEKLQQAVETINEFLQVNHNNSKFVFHDGLDRYFVQVIDSQTEEVVKEIPPKKLLDAFYEMQKLLGMIVDEKI